MAGERRGKVFEGVIVTALQSQDNARQLQGCQLVWDKSFPGLSVRPDISYLRPDGSLAFLAQVTYSLSETHEREKFWRDFSELIDIKSKLQIPLLYVAMLPNRRAKLGKAILATRDASIIVLEEDFGKDIDALVNQIVDELPKVSDQNIILDLAKTISGAPKFAASFRRFAECLTAKIDSAFGVTPIQEYWNLVQRDCKNAQRTIVAKETAIKRGVAYLSVFPKEYRQAIYDNARNGALLPVPPVVSQLCKLAAPVGKNSGKIVAPEVSDVIDLFSPIRIERIIFLQKESSRQYLLELDNLLFLREQMNWVFQHLEELKNARRLGELLNDCFLGNLSWRQGGHYTNCWLFVAIKSIIADQLGRQGTGWIIKVVEDSGKLRSVLVGLDFPKFERREKNMEAALIKSVAISLSEQLGHIDPKIALLHCQRAVEKRARHVMMNGLVCNGMDATKALLEDVFSGKGRMIRLESCITGYIRDVLQQQDMRANDLATEGMVIGKTFIHWKTAHEGHRVDKTKELKGRIAHVKIAWDKSSHRFKLNRKIEKFVLIIDGSWKTVDLSGLHNSGWDVVMYPDSIDELPKIVV
jgi:hypothetical protein